MSDTIDIEDLIEKMAKTPETPEQKASREKLHREVQARQDKSAQTLSYSNRVAKVLKGDHDDTDDQAKFLANICQQLDERFGTGSQLTLEWVIDHYLGLEYHRNIAPKLAEMYNALVKGKHTLRNKAEHFKGYTYYIPTDKSKKVMVMTNENNGDYNKPWSWLVIIDENVISEKVYVRKIWTKTRLDCIQNVDQPTLSFYRKIKFDMCYDNGVYGDARDRGHVMSLRQDKPYDKENGVHDDVEAGKCDHSLWHMDEALRWFFEVGCEHTEHCCNGEHDG